MPIVEPYFLLLLGITIIWESISLGITSWFLLGLAGAVAGSIIARSVKLRLWEAGRMAERIAGGDYRARLEPGPDDEVGWMEKQLNQMAAQLKLISHHLPGMVCYESPFPAPIPLHMPHAP